MTQQEIEESIECLRDIRDFIEIEPESKQEMYMDACRNGIKALETVQKIPEVVDELRKNQKIYMDDGTKDNYQYYIGISRGYEHSADLIEEKFLGVVVE